MYNIMMQYAYFGIFSVFGIFDPPPARVGTRWHAPRACAGSGKCSRNLCGWKTGRNRQEPDDRAKSSDHFDLHVDFRSDNSTSKMILEI